MKTTILIIAMVIGGFIVKAQQPYVNYVITTEDTVICDKIHVGLRNTTCVLSSGYVIKYRNSYIKSYSIDNETFAEIPIYRGNQPTKQKAMMKLVAMQNGIRVYKYLIRENGLEIPHYYCSLNNRIINVLKNPTRDQLNNYVHLYVHDAADEQLLSSK